MLEILSKLNDKEGKSGIALIHKMVNHILELEVKLNNYHKLGSNPEFTKTMVDSLKQIYNFYSKNFSDMFKLNKIFKKGFWRSARNDVPIMINELQDLIRIKLMKEISFDDVNNLTEGSSIRIAGKFRKYNENSFIGLINKFRYVESKYNKYIAKFYSQYLAFINTIKMDCTELTSYSKKLENLLDNYKEGYHRDTSSDMSKERQMVKVEDLTLCENYSDINQKLSKSLDNLTIESLKTYEKIKAQNTKYKKNPFYRYKVNRRLKELQKQKEKNEVLLKLTKNVKDKFTTYFDTFKVILNKFNDIFKITDDLGLHSYTSNFPKKTNKQLKNDIEMLSKNQTFIKDFINMISPLKDEADELYQKVFKDLLHDDIIENNIIPQITLNTNTSLEILSIDMNMYKDSSNSKITFNDTFDNLTIQKEDSYTKSIEDTNILCIQNLLENEDPTPEESNIKDIVVVVTDNYSNTTNIGHFYPVCKSGCGKRINNDANDGNTKYSHYNVIYVKDTIFDSNEITIIKDQSYHFKLSNLDKDINDPNLKAQSLSDKQDYFNSNHKSFAAVSIMIEDTTMTPPIKKGITIVSTELIGSNQTDLQYYKEISGVTKDIDVLVCRATQVPAIAGDEKLVGIKKTFTGLQNIQYIELVNEIVRYTSYKPNIICGSFGNIPKSVYDTLFTHNRFGFQDEITKLFTDTYFELTNKSIVSGAPEELLQEFKNYFVGTGEDNNRTLLYDDYNITDDTTFESNFAHYFKDKYKFKNLTSFIINHTNINICPDTLQVGGVSKALQAQILKASRLGKSYSQFQRKTSKKNQSGPLRKKLSSKKTSSDNHNLTVESIKERGEDDTSSNEEIDEDDTSSNEEIDELVDETEDEEAAAEIAAAERAAAERAAAERAASERAAVPDTPDTHTPLPPIPITEFLNNGFVLNYTTVPSVSDIAKPLTQHLDKKIVMKGGAEKPLKPRESSELYNKDEIKNIFNIVDTLLRTFSVGRKSYIQRDFGCLSIEKDYYERKLLGLGFAKKIENPSPYKIRNLGDNNPETIQENNKNKVNFYTLNFPSFIEVLLNQKTQNYNFDEDSNLYYSENQYSQVGKETDNLTPIFKKYDNLDNKNKQAIMNTAIRMLLIPSKDLKVITGKDLNDSTQFDQLDYASLALEFNTTFHKTAIIKLEERLKFLLTIDKNKTITPDSNEKSKSIQRPKHMIDLLLETKSDSKGSAPYLANINFDSSQNNLIFKLYEYLMCILKLKYYKFIDKNIHIPSKPLTGGAHYIDRRFIGNSMLTFNPTKKVSQKNLLNNTMNTHITTTSKPILKTKKVKHTTTKDIKESKKTKEKKQSRNKKDKQHKLSKKN